MLPKRRKKYINMEEETRDIKIIDLLKMISMGKIPKYVYYLGFKYTIVYDSKIKEPISYEVSKGEDFFEYLTFQDLNEYVTIPIEKHKELRKEHEDLYNEYLKTTTRKSYVKFN